MIVPLALLLFSAHDWLIVPGERIGPFEPDITEAEVVTAFGAGNVRRGKVHVGEGDYEEALLVYPDDPSKRLAIVRRTASPKGVLVYVCAEAPQAPCRWKTAEGVTLGTTLKRLEVINRRPFALSGFAWDYEGTVLSWEGGRLAPTFVGPERFLLRLHPRPEASGWRVFKQVVGDRGFSSGHPAMQVLNPFVYEMILRFPYEP